MEKQINLESTPYVIFSCISPVVRAKMFDSIKDFKNQCRPIVITNRQFSKQWKLQNVTYQIAKYNSIAKYKVPIRSLFIRSNLLRKSWVYFSNIKPFRATSRFFMPPHTARHFEYLKVFENLNQDDWAFLVGSRDLIFQVSPMLIANELKEIANLHFFDEGGVYFKDGNEQLNGKSAANFSWTKQLLNFNDRLVKEISENVIINADCIFGKISFLKEFLEASCELLSKSEFSTYVLLDQASTNIVGYRSIRKNSAIVHKNGDYVLNMCGVISGNFEIDDGKLLKDKRLIPIIHQFDRFGNWDMKSRLQLNRKYGVNIG